MTSFVVYSSALPVGRTEFRTRFHTYTDATKHLKEVCTRFATEFAPNDPVHFESSEESSDQFQYRVKYDDKLACGMYFLCRGSEVDAFRKTWDVGYVRTARHMVLVAHLGICEVPDFFRPVTEAAESTAIVESTQEHDEVLSELRRVINEFEARRGNRMGGDEAFRLRKEDYSFGPTQYTQSDFVKDLVAHKKLLRETYVAPREQTIKLGRII